MAPVPSPTDSGRSTVPVEAAVFNIQNIYLGLGDQLESLLVQAGLDHAGPVPDPSLLPALVTCFQYAEALADGAAAQATRARSDWKYALHLGLHHPGLPPEALREFRAQVSHRAAWLHAFERVLAALADVGLFASRQKPRLTVCHVLQAVGALNRLDSVRQTLVAALEAGAASRSEWLRAAAPAHWYQRYGAAGAAGRLPLEPAEQTELAQRLGADVHYLLDRVEQAGDPALAALPEFVALRRIWEQQFEFRAEELAWRPA